VELYSKQGREETIKTHAEEGTTMKRACYFLMIGLWIGALVVGTAAAGTKHQGDHSMSGTVTDIDHQTGLLSLKTGAGELQLHFPPQAIKDVKEGDQLTVHLGFSKGGAASATPSQRAR
jgi:hypothetical protein